MPDAKETHETDSSAVAENHAAEETFVDSGAGEPDRLERLWAPYRMAYIAKRSKDPFVEAPQGSDEEGLIIARGNSVYALLNLFPYNAGHLMVVPYRKESQLENLTQEESQELMAQAGFTPRSHQCGPKPGSRFGRLGGRSPAPACGAKVARG